jgi:chromosome partitioning protein
VVAQKGGSAKTTVLVHLAVQALREGHKVAIIDIDPQASATGWHRVRAQQSPALATVTSAELPDALESARRRGFDLVLIDTPSHTASAAMAAIKAADFVLIPCQPSAIDIAALGATVDMLKAASRPGAVVITRARPGPDLEQAEAVIKAMGLPVAPTIGDRVAYKRAIASGQAVVEFEPEGKAAAEIQSLWSWTKNEEGRIQRLRGNRQAGAVNARTTKVQARKHRAADGNPPADAEAVGNPSKGSD